MYQLLLQELGAWMLLRRLSICSANSALPRALLPCGLLCRGLAQKVVAQKQTEQPTLISEEQITTGESDDTNGEIQLPILPDKSRNEGML